MPATNRARTGHDAAKLTFVNQDNVATPGGFPVSDHQRTRDPIPSAFDLVLLQLIAEVRIGLRWDDTAASTLASARHIAGLHAEDEEPLSWSARRRLAAAHAEAATKILAHTRPGAG